MEKVLSLIIPTYNMEKYLNKCLDSLIVENMDLLEVLIINDGSKDNSSKIAHEYETKYPRTFRVIDKENGNYGSCVNRGLKEATGKYVKVLDADDYFDSINFNDYLKQINKFDVDLIITDYNNVDTDYKITKQIQFDLQSMTSYNFDDVYKLQEIKDIQMHAVTFRREYILSLNYKQTEGISYTDREWTFLPIAKVKTVYYYNRNIYNYLLGREGQTMDPQIVNKQMSQTIKIVYNKLDIFRKSSDLTKVAEDFLVYRLLRRIKQIYSFFLLENSSSSKDEVTKFDSNLQNNYPEFYQLIQNECKIKNIKYIKLWKENPSLFKIIVFMHKIYVRFIK